MTSAGRRQLANGTNKWKRLARAIGLILDTDLAKG
jgi:hypothetical protein